jgi:hypothetical protein
MGRRLTATEAIELASTSALSTKRADRERIDRDVRTLYRGAGLSEPEVIWSESPRQACLLADERVGPIQCTTFAGDRIPANNRPPQLEDEITHIVMVWPAAESVLYFRYGFEFEQPSYPDSLWRPIGFGHGARLHPSGIGSYRNFDQVGSSQQWAVVRLTENVGWWRFHRSSVFLSERPESIVADQHGRPSNTGGPAVSFSDGWEVYAVDGMRVPAWAVEHPEHLLATEIDAIRNVEVRRIFISLSGGGYIEHRGNLLHADKWGELWEVPDVSGGFLRVVDATAMPTGEHKRYWLRVPPTVRTAHAAVAWTFDLEPGAYDPIRET